MGIKVWQMNFNDVWDDGATNAIKRRVGHFYYIPETVTSIDLHNSSG